MNKIYVDGRRLIDENGCERIFNGVNVVDKSPYSEGKQTVPVFSEEMLAGLAANGFNLIRLGFTWAKIEPQPGKYNDEYLDEVEKIIDLCEKYGIYVYLDMHQDLYSPVTNGDGAPAWAALTEGRKVYPTRFVWAEDYFWGRACHRAFDNFWNNTPVSGKGLQDYFADCWAHIAQRLGGKAPVIGFDILNEPFPGTPGGKCFRRLVAGTAKTVMFGKEMNRSGLIADALSKDRVEKVLGRISYQVLKKASSGCDALIYEFDKDCYGPFMNRVCAAVREKCAEKILFLENSYYSNLGIPYNAPAIEIGGKRDPQQLFAPHAYDFMVDTPEYVYASDDRVGGIFGEHKRSQKKLDMPVIVGEWGGFGSSEDYSWLRHIKFLLNLFDSNKWSNTYWHYSDSHMNTPLSEVLSRPYPAAVQGEIKKYGYDFDSEVFTLDFVQEKAGESVIRAPREAKKVTLDGADCKFTAKGSEIVIKSKKGGHKLVIEF